MFAKSKSTDENKRISFFIDIPVLDSTATTGEEFHVPGENVLLPLLSEVLSGVAPVW